MAPRAKANNGLEENLDLTESQKEALNTIRLRQTKIMTSSRNELDIKMAQLKAAISTDKPDMKQIDEFTSSIGKLKADQFESRINTAIEIRKLLDDEQKIKFDQMASQMLRSNGVERMRQSRHRRYHRGVPQQEKDMKEHKGGKGK
jgi:Spy/CpxP family protein refolding chaperone